MKKEYGGSCAIRAVFIVFLACFLSGSDRRAFGNLPPDLSAGQATGGISGRVTDEAGAGIQNIKVVIYSYSSGWHATWTKCGEAWTDGGGSYAFSGLATNYYSIDFNSAGLDYVSEQYDNLDFLNFYRQRISVTDGLNTSNIDAQFGAGRPNFWTGHESSRPGRVEHRSAGIRRDGLLYECHQIILCHRRQWILSDYRRARQRFARLFPPIFESRGVFVRMV